MRAARSACTSVQTSVMQSSPRSQGHDAMPLLPRGPIGRLHASLVQRSTHGAWSGVRATASTHPGPVHLAPPDPTWPEQYAAVADRVARALGEMAVLVEHVGSTSVPGLAAKPILDVLLLVHDAADEAAYVPPLEDAGLLLHVREPDWHQHRLFRDEASLVNLHVFGVGSEEAERMLLFRDRLRADGDERALYESTGWTARRPGLGPAPGLCRSEVRRGEARSSPGPAVRAAKAPTSRPPRPSGAVRPAAPDSVYAGPRPSEVRPARSRCGGR